MDTEAEVAERSYKRIQDSDLQRLADLARKDLNRLFNERPRIAGYKNRLLMLCLCQGAAKHFACGEHGVKDFDVWAFFAESPDLPPLGIRKPMAVDFGPSRFGRNPKDNLKKFKGRRVDMLRKAIECDGKNPEKCVRAWLKGGKTLSARKVSERPVVVIYPKRLRGKVIWTPKTKTIRRGRTSRSRR